MKIKIKFTACLLLILSFILETNIYLQENPKEPSQKNVIITTNLYKTEENKNRVVLVSGQTNLPSRTILKIELKIGISLINSADDIRLLDVAKVSVNNDGQYFVRFIDSTVSFVPEYYEATITLAPEQPHEILLADGFSKEEINHLKSYKLLNIFSSDIPQRRQQSSNFLNKQVKNLTSLHENLINKIDDIEKLKQDDPEMGEILRKTFLGVKTEKELMEALSKDWIKWEKEWADKINDLIRKVKSEKILVDTSVNFYENAHKIIKNYQQYRQKAFDDMGLLKQSPMLVYSANPTETLKNTEKRLINNLENELILRISRDIIARTQEILFNHQKCLENKDETNENWARFKESINKYFASMKQEIYSYAKNNLFTEISLNRGKYKDIKALFELESLFFEKMNALLINPNNIELKTATHELLDLINQKASNILSN